jgi:hypothetical protein
MLYFCEFDTVGMSLHFMGNASQRPKEKIINAMVKIEAI